MDNPYEAPSAELFNINLKNNFLKEFKFFSTWYVFILSIITLGIYPLYWLYNRTKKINRTKELEPIPESFIYSVLILYVFSILAAYYPYFYQVSKQYFLYVNLFSYFVTILVLVWVFKFRNRLNNFLSKTHAPCMPLGPVITFFFQVLYLSFKLNEIIEMMQEKGDK